MILLWKYLLEQGTRNFDKDNWVLCLAYGGFHKLFTMF